VRGVDALAVDIGGAPIAKVSFESVDEDDCRSGRVCLTPERSISLALWKLA
jgi:hypothetical protein